MIPQAQQSDMSEPRLLPSGTDPPFSNRLARKDFHRAGPVDAREWEGERPAVNLAHYFWVVKRHLWKVAMFVAAAVISTYIVSKRLTPIYESTLTITVDRQMPNGIVGQDATRAMFADLDQYLATQVRIIQSDSVIRPVVRQFHLMPPERAGQSRETPVGLSGLRANRVPGTYLLLISYRSPDPDMAADIANAVARSYRDRTFDLRYRTSADLAEFMQKQMEELRAKTERSSAVLEQFERDLSMINPEQKTSIVSARLIQLNTEYTNAETERVRKESAWRSVQTGTLEALQISSQGGPIQGLADRITDARQKLQELGTRLGVNHTDYRKAALQVAELEKQFVSARQDIVNRVETEYQEVLRREEMFKKEFLDTKAEFDVLNAHSFQYTSLKREADMDRGFYDELVRKIKEAGINAGFQNNSINISDPARRSVAPIYPNIPSNLTTALILSIFLGLAAAIVSDLLDSTIRDPAQARTLLGTEVMGSLPMVRAWTALIPPNAHGESHTPALTRKGDDSARPATGFEEAVRALRNSLLLSNFEHPLKSLMFTSASPCEGKTTVAVHFAIAHAQQQHKTLLIDCDLRRPGAHSLLGVKPETGLAAALRNGHSWRDKLIRFETVPGLTLLPAGPSSRHCADLIGASLDRILAEAEPEYDLIVVDSLPILGFPEPMQMAAAVDGVAIVAVAGQTNRKAIAAALTTLRRLRANVLGLILNEVSSATSDAYYYHGSYEQYYKRYSAEDTALAGNSHSRLAVARPQTVAASSSPLNGRHSGKSGRSSKAQRRPRLPNVSTSHRI